MMKTRFLAGVLFLTTLLGVPQANAQTPGGGQQVVPVSDIVFVIDRSASISSTKYREMLEAAAASIGSAIPAHPAHRVAVVVFNNTGVLAVPFISADHPMLPDLIEGVHTAYPVGNATDVGSGLARAHSAFVGDPSAAFMNQVILLTDHAEECAFIEASVIRQVDEARISIGWIQDPDSAPNDCDDLLSVYDLDDYHTLVNERARYQVRIANAPINPPYVGPLFAAQRAGVLRCLDRRPEPSEYASFLDEALCPIRHPASADSDGNGVPDTCEFSDCDGNGVADRLDPDCDRDGIPDACETDCTGDGIPDPCDCNCNGVFDWEELDDCDGDGIPDDCETDCDGDGIPDDCELDCDDDGIPDDCEIDCDGDGVPNDCDSEPDTNGNGIPDNCDPDCDEDGIPDDIDEDRDGDGVLDIHDRLIGPCSGTLYEGPIQPGGGGSGCGSGGIGD